MKYCSFFIPLLIVFVGLASCQRNDDEPVVSERKISRLYISTSDYVRDGGNSYYNVFVVDPADSAVFPPIDSIYKFTSGARGGKFITYSPFNGGVVFQSSQNYPNAIDTSIYVMGVSRSGVLSSRNEISFGRLNNVLGISYELIEEGNLTADYLLALKGDVDADTMFFVTRPTQSITNRKPRFYLPLNFNSWGVNTNKRDVVVSSYTSEASSEDKPDAFNGVVVFKGLLNKLAVSTPDTLFTNVDRFNLPIQGAKTVRGISYSEDLDLLVVTDYEGTGATSVGRILFFEKFYKKYTVTQTISPDRVIVSKGKLKQPLAVAIDGREGGSFIYVADAEAKRVFRFSINDSGDVVPNQELNLNGRTPFSLYLDAR